MPVSPCADNSKQPHGLRLVNLYKTFQLRENGATVTAVDNVSLNVAKGELVTLLGPSGCGKTTTMRLIAGIESPVSGDIFLDNQNITRLPANRRGVSLVFQHYALFPHLSVWENIAYGLKARRMPKDQIRLKTAATIQAMQLTGLDQQLPKHLSGGQQQRVALARAIIIEPDVLLFDEPLSSLDLNLREQMRQELREQQQKLNITSLYVTHDQAEAMAISDRIAIMHGGRIVQAGSPQEIYQRPNCPFVAGFVGKANFLNARFLGHDNGYGLIETQGQQYRFTAEQLPPSCENAPLLLMFRPESASLSQSPGGLPGRIRRTTYYGHRLEYEIALADKLVMVEEYCQTDTAFAPGDKIYLHLNPEKTSLMLPEN